MTRRTPSAATLIVASFSLTVLALIGTGHAPPPAVLAATAPR